MYCAIGIGKQDAVEAALKEQPVSCLAVAHGCGLSLRLIGWGEQNP